MTPPQSISESIVLADLSSADRAIVAPVNTENSTTSCADLGGARPSSTENCLKDAEVVTSREIRDWLVRNPNNAAVNRIFEARTPVSLYLSRYQFLKPIAIAYEPGSFFIDPLLDPDRDGVLAFDATQHSHRRRNPLAYEFILAFETYLGESAKKYDHKKPKVNLSEQWEIVLQKAQGIDARLPSLLREIRPVLHRLYKTRDKDGPLPGNTRKQILLYNQFNALALKVSQVLANYGYNIDVYPFDNFGHDKGQPKHSGTAGYYLVKGEIDNTRIFLSPRLNVQGEEIPGQIYTLHHVNVSSSDYIPRDIMPMGTTIWSRGIQGKSSVSRDGIEAFIKEVHKNLKEDDKKWVLDLLQQQTQGWLLEEAVALLVEAAGVHELTHQWNDINARDKNTEWKTVYAQVAFSKQPVILLLYTYLMARRGKKASLDGFDDGYQGEATKRLFINLAKFYGVEVKPDSTAWVKTLFEKILSATPNAKANHAILRINVSRAFYDQFRIPLAPLPQLEAVSAIHFR